jgi:hypothetical protein
MAPSAENSLNRWVTYANEWYTGYENLDASNPLYLWVYLIVSPLSDHDPKQYVKFPDYSSQVLCKFI